MLDLDEFLQAAGPVITSAPHQLRAAAFALSETSHCSSFRRKLGLDAFLHVCQLIVIQVLYIVCVDLIFMGQTLVSLDDVVLDLAALPERISVLRNLLSARRDCAQKSEKDAGFYPFCSPS